MELQREGRPIDAVIADLEAKRAHDARWQDGRTFGMVYDGGPGVHEVAERAAAHVPARERAQHEGVPVARRDPERGGRVDGVAAARPADGGRLPHQRRHRVDPVRRARGPRARPGRARHPRRRDRRRRVGARRVPQVGPPVRHADPHRAGARRLDRRRRRDGRRRRTSARCSWSARRRSTRRASSTRSRRSPSSPPRSAPTATSTRAWAASCCRSPRCSGATYRRGTSASTACTRSRPTCTSSATPRRACR